MSRLPQQAYNLNPMAPPGTMFRAPAPLYQQPQQQYNSNSQSQAQTQFSDFGDVDGQISDTDDDEISRGDIPPSFANGRSLGAQERFKQNISTFGYNPNAQRPAGMPPAKRPAGGDFLSAYGNVSRPAKQQRTMPPTSNRPIPGQQRPTLPPARKKIKSFAEIPDFSMRSKAEMIYKIMSHCSADDILRALEIRKGNVDDAIDTLMNGLPPTSNAPVDLTGDDEDAEGSTDSEVEILGATRLAPKPAPKPTANRNFEAQKAGIGAYSRLQQKKPEPASAQSDLLSSPPRKPLSRLKAGIRPDRSRESSAQPAPGPRKLIRKPVIEDDEESDAAETDEEPEVVAVVQRETVDEKVFKFLVDCTQKELVSMIDCKPEDAEFLLSKKPFKSLDAVRRINRPAVPGKRKGGNQRPLGDRMVDQLVLTEESLQAVDRVVDRCQMYLGDVQQKMSSLGIDLSKAVKDDGLAIASFDETGKESPKVDSGTGTPTPHSSARIEQPASMSKDRRLKDYQLVGLNWLAVMYSLRRKWDKQNGCILADEMGLGKTYQVISFISHLVETGDVGKHLVVVPSSTLENWLREFKMFSPDLHVEPYYGKQSQRKDMQYDIEAAGDAVKVIVTTYSIASSEKDNAWLRTFRYSSCVFDEGHMLKNAKSKRYRALSRVKAGFRLFLTGTPLQNNLQELVSVLAFIMPSVFQDAEDDLELIFDCKAKTNDSDHAALLAAQRTSRAKEMLKPFILRRTKDQVLKDLPAKTNRIVYCDMTPKQKEVYDEYTRIHEEALAERLAGKKASEAGQFPHLQDRRSAAIHPLLRRTIYQNDDIRDKIVPKIDRKGRPWSGKSNQTIFEELTWFSDWELHEVCEKYKIKKPGPLKSAEWMDSGKVSALIELLREHKAAGSRTLIFSQYAKVLDILGRVLETEEVAHVRLDGTTPTEDRLALIDKFNDDTSIQAFMITTRSGGAGINLATADKVIIVDPSFNPQDDVQAANRAHRIGQTRPVEVVTLVTRGTIEEQIYKLGLSKLALDQRVAGGEYDEAQGGALMEREGMRRIEDMLMKGQTTPPDESESEEGGVKEKEREVKKEEAAEDGENVEMAKEGVDIKDAFKDAMEAKGVKIVKDE
jgi:SWI/SNF-related matrix-associated actin-dependent regulator 1 of chromatin subfamily A